MPATGPARRLRALRAQLHPPPASSSAGSEDDGRLRLALIGCGSICHAHLNGLAALAASRIAVTCCIDASPERAAEIAALVHGSPAGSDTPPATFTSLAEALAAGAPFDAVDIMLPHSLHRPIATEALASGKHVLLEKPMANTLEDAAAILEAAAASGCVFMMAENSQYWPEVVAAKELIASGAIGTPLSGRAWHHGVHDRGADWAGRGTGGESAEAWRFDKEVMGGGVVIDGGAHWIRPLRMLLGEVVDVVGTTARPVADYEGESLGRALLRHEGGATSTYEATVLPEGASLGPGSAGWHVVGTEGELRIDAQSVGPGSVTLFNSSHPQGQDVSPSPPADSPEIVDLGGRLTYQPEPVQPCSGYPSTFGHELNDFAKAVLEGSSPAVPVAWSELSQPEHSLGEMRAALALYRSAESGQWERVWG